jgi:hypothetical protein
LILLSLGLLMLGWLLSGWHGGVHNGLLRLGCWLFQWLFRSSSFCQCWTRLYGYMWLGGCLRSWSPVTRDELPTRSSFPILFLGGILWVFSRAHNWWAPMLGFGCLNLLNSNEKGKIARTRKRKVTLKARQTVTNPSLRLNVVSVQVYL